MLKTSSTESAKPRKGLVGVGSDSRAGRNGSRIVDDEIDDEIDDKVDDEVDDEIRKKGRNLFKSKNLCKSKNLFKSKKTESGFLTSGARIAFTKLRQAFIKTLILHHFAPEYHIRVETDISSYAISGVFSQLSSDNSSWWYLVSFFSRKMIPAETRYKTHNSEFLAIVKAFKTWRHYLEESQYEMLVLTNYNNFY